MREPLPVREARAAYLLIDAAADLGLPLPRHGFAVSIIILDEVTTATGFVADLDELRAWAHHFGVEVGESIGTHGYLGREINIRWMDAEVRVAWSDPDAAQVRAVRSLAADVRVPAQRGVA